MAEKYIEMKMKTKKKKKKRKNFIKLLMLLIVLISVLITLCLKLSYFNVQKIDVVNCKNVSKEEIIKHSKISQGSNIFSVNLKESRTNILKNNNVMDVNIKRIFPSKIIITVKERDAVFYIQKDNKFLIVGKDGVVLEEKNSIENLKLMKLDGIDTKTVAVGKVVPIKDKRIIELIGNITDIYACNKSKYVITAVNISDVLNINVYYKSMCVKLGTPDNIEKKLNKALNVLENQKIIDKKGYIDVSYDGNPVFFIEN